MRKAAIVASGMTKFGIRQEVQWRELAMEGTMNTFKNSEFSPSDIDGLIVSSAYPERTAPGSHIAPWTAELIGAEPDSLITRVENLCASGNVGVIMGSAAIMTGMADLVLVLGVEKLNVPHPEGSRSEAFYNLGLGDKFVFSQGFTPPSFFSQVAKRYDEEYGLTDEQRASVSVKNHKFGKSNPNAHYQRETPVQEVLESPMISEPLRILECCPVTDGSAGVLLTSEERARELSEDPILFSAHGQKGVGNTISALEGEIHHMNLLETAANNAYAEAGITPEDVDVACVHDCFTISEIVETEYLGFCEKGEGKKFVGEGKSELGGEVTINPGGGLLSRGHPFGATGLAQVGEIFNQLRGTAECQVEDAEIGLTHNLSGYAGCHTVNLFEKG